jgi:hypothetical protein
VGALAAAVVRLESPLHRCFPSSSRRAEAPSRGQTLKATGRLGMLSNRSLRARRPSLVHPRGVWYLSEATDIRSLRPCHASLALFSTPVEISVQKGPGAPGAHAAGFSVCNVLI